ncbi:MAG TPA: glycosyltransferase [Sphingomonadaceae bacterium]|nr:glycosyltransferase [Sphingomonadaceae bacterium]
MPPISTRPRRIRVAHCLETVGSGGVEQTRLTLARLLPSDRYEQLVICTKAIGVLPQQLRDAGCPVVEVGVLRYPLDPRSHWRAFRALRRFGADIAHGAVVEGISLAAIGGRLARVPVILAEETSDPDNQRRGRMGTALYRALIALGDRSLAVSPATGAYLLQTLGLPASRVSTVLNGVVESSPSPPRAVAAIRASMNMAPSGLVIGCVGRLFDSHKKFSDAIRALPHIRAGGIDASLLLVGEGPDGAMLEALARELGVAPHVTFAGYQGDTRPYFEAMDIMVHPAATEAFGLVLVEAMFARLPVIATRVGGIPTVVEEGATAILVEPARPEQLSAAVLALARDPELCTSMGELGYARAKALFGAERYAADIDALYTELLKKKGVRASHRP